MNAGINEQLSAIKGAFIKGEGRFGQYVAHQLNPLRKFTVKQMDSYTKHLYWHAFCWERVCHLG